MDTAPNRTCLARLPGGELPTLIAGTYGMNFRSMPELAWPLGYPFSLAVMAASMVGAALFFKRHNWF